jgi:hypothetical protein
VGDSQNNTVVVFDAADLAKGATTPSRTLTGVNEPMNLAVDAAGNLYAANFGPNGDGSTVSVFAPGSTTPNRTLTGLDTPTGMAFEVFGNLYVGNLGGVAGSTVSVFAPGSTTPTRTLTGVVGPGPLAFDSFGNLFVGDAGIGSVAMFTPTAPIPSAGGVVIRTAQPDQPITLGGTSGIGLSLSNAELAQIFTVGNGPVTIGDATTGNITVAGNVGPFTGFSTLSLQTQGRINTANGATLATGYLALQAGTGIGTTASLSINATHLAFASQGGPIQISDASPVTLTGVAGLPVSSIPVDVFSSPNVGSVYTLLRTDGGVSGTATYKGQPLAEGATLTLADGHLYRISYQANGGQDVTLTRIANLTSVPPPIPPVGSPTTVPSVSTAIAAVSTLTPFAFGIGPGGVLDFFEVDTVGQVFIQGFSFFGPIGPVQFLSSSLHIPTDLAVATNNTVLAIEAGDQGALFLIDIDNPLAFFNPFVVNAVRAAFGL